jgi:hypothetical protein
VPVPVSVPDEALSTSWDHRVWEYVDATEYEEPPLALLAPTAL